jgi:hypothetical protein
MNFWTFLVTLGESFFLVFRVTDAFTGDGEKTTGTIPERPRARRGAPVEAKPHELVGLCCS